MLGHLLESRQVIDFPTTPLDYHPPKVPVQFALIDVK